jgi:hypothetical protein
MRGSTVYRLYTPKQLHRKIPTDFTENTGKHEKNNKKHESFINTKKCVESVESVESLDILGLHTNIFFYKVCRVCSKKLYRLYTLSTHSTLFSTHSIGVKKEVKKFHG